ncbi:MAG: S8 family serine peptidase [Ignavibacteriales bacterium]|nr:S8 family serine peptidase [Ignavibacteriales bacterium]
MKSKIKTEVCPFCKEEHTLVRDFNSSNNNILIKKFESINKGWKPEQGICLKCVDHFDVEILRDENLLPDESELKITTFENYIIPPTPWRLNADQRFNGNGVTICFIDSGFYLHPDLIKPTNRILKLVDVTSEQKSEKYFEEPRPENWHGTMTSCVCAGNGFLSNKFYKGIANEANVVLIKVWEKDGISASNITKGIRWAIENKEKYNIRIINLSVTDDDEVPYKESEIDLAAEEAIKKGIVIVAAVGNDLNAKIKAPASSPNVITVGGIDDHNSISPSSFSLYHSTFGTTIDGIQKPELIAPSIWIAAPILPNSNEHKEAKILFRLLSLKDDLLIDEFQKFKNEIDSEIDDVNSRSIEKIKVVINSKIKVKKYLTPDYMHADGTSFAAPIVCSIIAQMLEANPNLTPSSIREILITTASRMNNVDVKRQGYGIVNAKASVAKAIGEKHIFEEDRKVSPVVRRSENKIDFIYHNHSAKSIMLAGDINGWSGNGFIFTKENYGYWKCTIPLLPKGIYKYKFIIDSNHWISDPLNPFKEDDGYNGLNSKLIIE